MSNYEIDIFSSGKENSIRTYGDAIRETVSWLPANNVLLEKTLFPTYEAPDYNFIVNTVDVNNIYDTNVGIITRSMKLRIECAEGRRGFFIKIPNTVKIRQSDKTIRTESIILCCAHQNGTTYPINCPDFPSSGNTRTTTYTPSADPTSSDYFTDRTRTARLFVLNPTNLHEYVYEKLTGDSVAGNVNNHNLTAEEKTDVYNKLLAILNGITYTLEDNTLDIQEFRSYRDGNLFNIDDFGMVMNEAEQLQTYDMLPLPIFDYTQTEDILKYINTGDKSGALDVFDVNNPDKEVVEDFKSNAKTFITNLNNLGHVQFKTVWYNDEYIAGGEDVWGAYNVKCYERYFETDGTPKAWQYLTSASTKYPTITLDHSFSPVSDGEYWEVLYEMLAIDDYDEDGHLKGGFAWSVRYKHDNSKEYRVKVDSVHVYPNFNLTPTTFASTSKSNIVDGYRYTNETYNKWHEIYFRSITLDDLNGYDNPEDKEDDTSGSDSSFSGASGLRTFSISNSDFETINAKLWSTDWTTVFKSTSIDPVKCVISCKGIPFTADGVSSAEVIIANMNTGLTKNYVKSVKSFNVGSVLMPHYNDDFTDITLTHIRCYLPYIGWVELPASECISRVAYSKVGIEARPKRLKFKYLVDFVDGSVRCVVSVNDTERWFFDGNCSVDIPVTSDNHTQAVSNALRSGLQTGLSIATAVAGAYTSNAGAVAGGVIGAMQNAPNIFPTYSYTATANGSGYINASMNTHIMIVIERPNTIKSTDYAKRVGVPCGLSLNLGSLHGFTVCKEVDVTGIDATPDELAMIKSLLESGVYL